MPVVYFSQSQIERRNLVLLVRGAHIETLERPLRQIVASIDPTQPIYEVRPMIERVRETWATQRLLTFLLSTFAVLTLVLASVGLYGVIAYTSLRRVREIGVRLALGAQRSQILTLVLGHGARVTGAGLILGIAGAIGCARLLGSFLFGVTAIDASIYFAVSFLLALAALAACWLPARRASRVDPMVILRAE